MSAAKRQWENQNTWQVDTATADPKPLQELLEKPLKFTPDERTIILDTCCNGATKQEAEQLIAIAEARGMNPIAGECYFVKRWDGEKQRMVWAVQASIDSFRIKAEESGVYDGQDEPEYEYNEDGSLKLARVRIYRKDVGRAFVGVARYDEYVQKKKDGTVTKFWANMPHNQLSKCAESLGFRKAFPKRLAKIYTDAEMQQADREEPQRVQFERPAIDHAAGRRAEEESNLRESAMVACRDEIESATSVEQIAQALKTAKPKVNAGQLKELAARATRRRKELEAERDVPQESPNAEPEPEGRLPGED